MTLPLAFIDLLARAQNNAGRNRLLPPEAEPAAPARLRGRARGSCAGAAGACSRHPRELLNCASLKCFGGIKNSATLTVFLISPSRRPKVCHILNSSAGYIVALHLEEPSSVPMPRPCPGRWRMESAETAVQCLSSSLEVRRHSREWKDGRGPWPAPLWNSQARRGGSRGARPAGTEGERARVEELLNPGRGPRGCGGAPPRASRPLVGGG